MHRCCSRCRTLGTTANHWAPVGHMTSVFKVELAYHISTWSLGLLRFTTFVLLNYYSILFQHISVYVYIYRDIYIYIYIWIDCWLYTVHIFPWYSHHDHYFSHHKNHHDNIRRCLQDALFPGAALRRLAELLAADTWEMWEKCSKCGKMIGRFLEKWWSMEIYEVWGF